MLKGQLLDSTRVKEIKYGKLQKDELFRSFDSSEKRITKAEAIARLKKYGPNEIPHIGHRITSNMLVSTRALLSVNLWNTCELLLSCLDLEAHLLQSLQSLRM